MASKRIINELQNEVILTVIIQLLQKLAEVVLSILSLLANKNFKNSMHLPQFWGKENGYSSKSLEHTCYWHVQCII